MEGRVYKVDVEKNGEGYVLTLLSPKKHTVIHPDLDSAQEELCDWICLTTGDGEAVLDLRFLNDDTVSDRYWTIEANDRVDTLNMDELYPDGRCEICYRHVGARDYTKSRLIDRSPTADSCFTKEKYTLVFLFSETLVKELESNGVSASCFIPCVSKRGKKKFFELDMRLPRIDFQPVKLSIATFVGARKCSQCGFSSFVFFEKEGDRRTFILEECIKDRAPYYLAGDSFKERLLINDIVKRSLQSSKLRGIVYDEVAIIEPSQVNWNFTYTPIEKEEY